MKKVICFFILQMCISLSANAKTAYVTDTMNHMLRSGDSNQSKILTMLPSGTKLTVISENKTTGYSKVKTSSGKEGYILTRHTLKQPISQWYLDIANKKIEALQKENELITNQRNQFNNAENTPASDQELTQERDNLLNELNQLRQTAANAIQLKNDRAHLLERVISVERELEQVKRENMSLEDNTNQDWFLYGGMLSLFSIILGFILPKLSWGRKTSNWERF